MPDRSNVIAMPERRLDDGRLQGSLSWLLIWDSAIRQLSQDVVDLEAALRDAAPEHRADLVVAIAQRRAALVEARAWSPLKAGGIPAVTR